MKKKQSKIHVDGTYTLKKETYSTLTHLNRHSLIKLLEKSYKDIDTLQDKLNQVSECLKDTKVSVTRLVLGVGIINIKEELLEFIESRK